MVLIQASSYSQMINGSFEDSLATWKYYGGAIDSNFFNQITPGPVYVPSLIYTYCNTTFIPQAGGNFLVMVSGGTFSAAMMDSVAGLDSGTIESVSSKQATFGSIITKKIFAENGQHISFYLNFATKEDPQYWNSPTYGDYSFFSVSSGTLDTAINLYSTDYLYAIANMYFPGHPEYFNCNGTSFNRGNPSWEKFDYSFTSSDTFNISFGVLNGGDNNWNSFLLLDKIVMDSLSTVTDLNYNVNVNDSIALGATELLNAFYNNDTLSDEIFNSVQNLQHGIFRYNGLNQIYTNADADSLYYVPETDFVGQDSIAVVYFDNSNISKIAKMYFNVQDNTSIGHISGSDMSFGIFPNPASNKITLEIINSIGKSNVSILNINGQVLFKKQIYKSKTPLDISTLSSGIYFIEVTNENGFGVKKIIKE